MSASTSPSTGRRYGVLRVCSLWGVPRSSFYLERRWVCAQAALSHGSPSLPEVSTPASVGNELTTTPSLAPSEAPRTAPSEAVSAAVLTVPEAVLSQVPTANGLQAQVVSLKVAQASSSEGFAAEVQAHLQVPAAPCAPVVEPSAVGPLSLVPPLAYPRRRGPKPKLSDDQVLALVRADLAASPFRAEGHRKVHARLRRAGHAVFTRQVLRVMHAAQLLSPHRAPQGQPCVHDGTITTSEPDVMWGTDGLRVETVENGWVWIFVAVEHWNAEVMGWHVTKRGDRFAALEPLKQGLVSLGRGVGKDAGKGLSVRMDHGTQYTSEEFRNEVKHWGMELSYGYVKEPQTNGVAERFNRTLKEQVLRGRVWRNVEELRAAVGEFVRSYNEEWLLEKNGYQSPKEARRRVVERLAA